MSKSKPNDQTLESSRHHEHSFEQVMETARMLYALQPFEMTGAKSALEWDSLVRRANVFLDKLQEACVTLAERRRKLAEKSANAEAKKLPEIVPLNRAMREITNQHRTARAESNFKKFVLAMPDYFKAPTRKTLNAQIIRWQKTGIPRDEVMELQSLYDKKWRPIKAEENRRRARKRGPRLNPKDKPVIHEILGEAMHAATAGSRRDHGF